MKPFAPHSRPDKAEVLKAIRDLAGYSTHILKTRLLALKQNLAALSGPETKIVSLSERRKIKRAVAILELVVADRNGWTIPDEKIKK